MRSNHLTTKVTNKKEKREKAKRNRWLRSSRVGGLEIKKLMDKGMIWTWGRGCGGGG